MSNRNRRTVWIVLLLVVALVVLWGVQQWQQHHQSPTSPATTVTGAAGTAADALTRLPVKPADPHTGYSRDQFGPAWADVDHNGCDTRNDILKRDLTDPGYKSATDHCTIVSGVLHDPYTGHEITFTRGVDTSSKIQIDHVVAISDAWSTGAQHWTADQREQLANDPLELLAVDGPTNQAKGDGDASQWLPPNKSFDCPYVARQIAVKTKYQLWVTKAEHDAMVSVLDTCPGEPLPTT